MALDPVVNFFRSTIATLPVASGGTSIVLQTGDGNKLPAPAIDGAFNLTIYNADDPFVAPEIVRVTARSGDTLTVTRAQEGTSATNKTSGSTWNVELTPTAKTIQDIDSAKLDVAGGTMTGDLTIPDKIIHSGDTNTAIRFPANDTVSVETNGSEALRVTSGQRLGIKKTAPASVLHFVSDGGETAFDSYSWDSNSTNDFTIEIVHATSATTRGISVFEVFVGTSNDSVYQHRQVSHFTVYVSNNGNNSAELFTNIIYENSAIPGTSNLTVSATHGATDMTTITIGGLLSGLDHRNVWIRAMSREIVSFTYTQG